MKKITKKLYATLVLTCILLSSNFTAKAQGCFKQIAAGAFHSVAIKNDGTLWAWGYNDYGQLGDGTNTDKNRPVQIGSSSNWASVSAGLFHTIALKTDGTLWTWGNNSDGQLGDGTNTDKNTPVLVNSDADWASISLGGYHSLAIKTDGTLWAWGNNGFGQLGNGTIIDYNMPVQVYNATNWVSVSAGSYHTVAKKADGTLWAWGYNQYGQLGIGLFASHDSPLQIGYDANWAKLSCGANHTVAIKNDGTLWAWGHNYYGQVGDGTDSSRNIPKHIGGATNWSSISSGSFSNYSIAQKNDGTLWAWGNNFYGQFGNGTINTTASSPVSIGLATNWAKLATGSSHTLAIKTDGTLWAWGKNEYGQLGDGTNSNKNTPTGIACPGCTTTRSTFTITACDSYTWVANNNKVYTSSNNTDSIILTNAAGCDSIITLNLTVNRNNYTIQRAVKCVSYTWNVNGKTYTKLGTNYDTVYTTNSSGCIDRFTLELFIKASTSSNNNLTINANQLPYIWNGLTFTQAGTKTAVLTNVRGCDSLATLNLSVINLPTPCTTTRSTFTITACDSYTWVANNNKVYTSSNNTDSIILTSAAGCDSIITLNLTVNRSNYTIQRAVKCDSYTWNVNGKTYTKLGTNYDTVYTTNSSGCIDRFTLELYIKASTSSNNNLTINANQLPYIWNGLTFTLGGTKTAVLTNVRGCDSLATLNLTVIGSTPTITGVSSVCVGSSIILTSNVLGGVWSHNGRVSITNNGNGTATITGTSGGTSTITYKLGTQTITKVIAVFALPAVPNIGYASGTSNPQYGCTSSLFGKNRTFALVGTPSGGEWIATGQVTITPLGVATTSNTNGTGSVTYTFTNNNTCSSSRTITGSVGNCAGKGLTNPQLTVDGQKLFLYPNPAKNMVNLKLQNVSSGSIILTDMYGKTISTQIVVIGNNVIDISKIAKGTYFVTLVTEQNRTTQKLIVE